MISFFCYNIIHKLKTKREETNGDKDELYIVTISLKHKHALSEGVLRLKERLFSKIQWSSLNLRKLFKVENKKFF